MDAPPTDEPLPGKASFTFWLLAALLLLVMSLIGFSLFGPNPPIEIGKATTHITTPLDANGLPDYAAALLAESRKGVTPENNGAIPFLMAMWPEEGGDEAYSAEDAKLLCAELGMSEIPPKEGRVTSLNSNKYRLGALRLLRDRMPKPEGLVKQGPEESLVGIDPDTGYMSEEEFFICSEVDAIEDARISVLLGLQLPYRYSWTAEELPFVAEWLKENDSAINCLLEAAERTKWHIPVPDLLQCGSGTVARSLSYGWQSEYTKPADLLTIRSSFFHGEKRYAEATRDVLAILRLANHTSMRPMAVDQFTAIDIAKIGLIAIDQISADKAISGSTLRSLLERFNQIGPFSRMLYSIDHGERFMALDYVIDSSEERDLDWTGIKGADALEYMSYDWNFSLKALNDHYDAVVMATTHEQRQAAYAQVEAKRTGISFPPKTTREIFSLFTAHGRGQAFSDICFYLLVGNYTSFCLAEDCVNTRRQLSHLGIALAIYRAEHEAYPISLDKLVPDIMEEVLVDVFYNNPFVYRKIDDGYLLYSLGLNGQDEGGSGDEPFGTSKYEGIEVRYSSKTDADSPYSKIPAGADDLSLRVPLPEPEPWPWEAAP